MQPFMVLVGPNGAGKTNFVQALELFGAILERGNIEPVREIGYDELIRREKKPARAGLTLAATLRSSRDRLSRLRKTSDPASTNNREFKISAKFTIRGSVQADDLQLGAEQMTVVEGQNYLNVNATKEDVVTTYHGDAEFVELLQMLVPVLARSIEKNSSNVGAQLSKRAKELGEEFLGTWLLVPRLFPRSLAREVAVTRLRLDSSTLRGDALTSERHKGFIGPAGEGLALAVDRLRGHGDKPSPAFTELLHQLNEVYPRIEDVEPVRIQPGRLVLTFKERGIADSLGQSNISDGVLHALAFLLAINPSLGSTGVLAVEEPENAIHPWPLRRIISRAQAVSQGTLIITTHSPIVVSAIKDPGSLFVVEQADEGGTAILAAHDREEALEAILRESGKKLGELWIEGGLGGVPTV